ncbi:hypothetical protein LDBPK_361330, partial [Leishmania donovani]
MEILSLPSLRAYTYTSIYIDIYIYIYIFARYWWHRCVCTGPLCWFSFFSFPFFLFFFFYSSLWRCIPSYIQAGTRVHTRTCTHKEKKRNEVGLFVHLFECVPSKAKKRNTTTKELKKERRKEESCWKNDASTILKKKEHSV